eukprot:8115-Hanusia_phi.AAC.1
MSPVAPLSAQQHEAPAPVLTAVVGEPGVVGSGRVDGDDEEAVRVDRPCSDELEGELLRVEAVGLLEVVDRHLHVGQAMAGGGGRHLDSHVALPLNGDERVKLSRHWLLCCRHVRAIARVSYIEDGGRVEEAFGWTARASFTGALAVCGLGMLKHVRVLDSLGGDSESRRRDSEGSC